MSVSGHFNIKISIKPVSCINSVVFLNILFYLIKTMPVSLTIFCWPSNKSVLMILQVLSVSRHLKSAYEQGQFQNFAPKHKIISFPFYVILKLNSFHLVNKYLISYGLEHVFNKIYPSKYILKFFTFQRKMF